MCFRQSNFIYISLALTATNCTFKNRCLNIVGLYGSWKTWKVMEFSNFIFQAWSVLKFRFGSWKSWKISMLSINERQKDPKLKN